MNGQSNQRSCERRRGSRREKREIEKLKKGEKREEGEKRKERKERKEGTDVRPGPTARDDLESSPSTWQTDGGQFNATDSWQFYGNNVKRGESDGRNG